MRVWRIVGVLSLSSVLLLSGCFLKKKKPPLPPQAQAPTVEPTAPPPEPSQPEAQPPAATTTTPPAPEKTVTEKKPAKPRHRKPAKKAEAEPGAAAKATTPPAVPPRNKIVIREGGTDEATPQLSARLPREPASHENMTTEQLLDSAEANLRGLNRQLSAGEQEMVGQIRSYMQQSRQATTEGDAVRAHNLALKAHLLSDQLAGR